MIAGDAFITPHAVKQYCRRINSRVAYSQALAEIIRALKTRVRKARQMKNGAIKVEIAGFETRSGLGAFEAIIGRGEGSLPAVITIGPPANRTASNRRSKARREAAKRSMETICSPC